MGDTWLNGTHSKFHHSTSRPTSYYTQHNEPLHASLSSPKGILQQDWRPQLLLLEIEHKQTSETEVKDGDVLNLSVIIQRMKNAQANT